MPVWLWWVLLGPILVAVGLLIWATAAAVILTVLLRYLVGPLVRWTTRRRL